MASGMPLAVVIRSGVALAGRYPLLAGVDLDVHVGEVVALMGPNGAGKTSLVRVMAGLLPLSEGKAEVLGYDPARDARKLRPLVGLLGHRNGLYHDLSAEENVRFCLRAARLPVSRLAPALAQLNLTGRLARVPTGKLSAGQRRRVALACLVAKAPRLWLLDEPHSGLDAEHRQLLDSLLRAQAAAGGTVVMASHDSEAALALAQRTVVMAGGAVVEAFQGPPAASTGTSPDLGLRPSGGVGHVA